MRGRYSGLAARVQEVENRAIYIHCHAYLLNLALQSACCAVKDVRNVLGTVNSLYDFLEGSAKRHAKFTEVQHTSACSGNHPQVTLKRLCETRWAARYRAVHAVFTNYLAVLETLSFQRKTRANPGLMLMLWFSTSVLLLFFSICMY